MAGLKFEITGDNSSLLRSFRESQQAASTMAKGIEESGASIDSVLSRLTTAAGGLITAFSAQQFGSKVMQIRGEFQQLEVAFETMLGSAADANRLMDQLVRTAATTPFDLQSVADGARRLLAYGTSADEVNETLVRLGDIAAGLSIPLGDLVYLYGTTMVQGRLFSKDLHQFTGRGIPIAKEITDQFGVAEGKILDLVEAGKVGAAEVKRAIISMTSEGGKFGGLMEKQSHTITGQISNIEDAIDSMFNKIGKQNEGVINAGLEGVSMLVENWETIGKVVLEVAVAYGAYKAALLAVWAAHKVQAIYGAVTAFLSIAKGVHTAKDAMLLFNMAAKANPLGIMVSIIASATAAFYLFGKSADAVAKAQESVNNIKDEAISKIEEEKNKIEILNDAAKNNNLSIDERKKAARELNRIIPNYNAHLDETTGKYIANKNALDKYILSLQRKYELEGAKDKLKELGKRRAEAMIAYRKAVREAEEYDKGHNDNEAFGGAFAAAMTGGMTPTRKQAREAGIRGAKQAYKDSIKEIESTQKAIKDAFGLDIQKDEISKKNSAKDVKKTGSTGRSNSGKQIDYDKMARERSDAERELSYKATQAYIDAMEDGYEKEKAQRDFNHRKELDDLERYKQDFIRKKVEDAKEIFEADPKNKGKKFNASAITLTQEEQSKFGKMKEDIVAKQLNEGKENQRRQIDALNAYLKEYGSFEEKKLAITQEYEEKIRKASSVGEKATLEMQRDKEIESAKHDELQNTIDWNGIFSDLQGHTKQYLQGLRSQLQGLLDTGNLPIDQMQIVSDKINAIDNELGKQQGIWSFIGERAREHNRLLKEAAAAQERLNIAKENEKDAASNLASIKSEAQKKISNAGLDLKIDEISTSLLNGKIDLTDEKFKGMSVILQALAVAEGKLTDARKKVTDATNKARQAEDGAKRSSSQAIADWFSDAQEFIASKGIDQLPDLLGSIGLGGIGDKVGKGIEGFNSAVGAAADFASGNYIGAALKGISAIKSFGSALGIGGGNESRVTETTVRLTKSNEFLRNSIDGLKDSIDKSSGSKAVDSYQQAVDNQKQVIRNTMEILKAQMGYHSAHHSNAYYWNLSKSDYEAINATLLKFSQENPLAETIRNSVNSLEDIYQLTPEQMKAISDEQVQIWQKMLEQGKYDKSEYWQKYVELAGQLEELTKKINENLTQTSFRSLHEDFVSTIMDMDATATDFADNFTEMMAKAWTNAAVGNIMDDELKKFYAKWSKKMQTKDADGNKANFSKGEIDEMRAEYQTLVNQALNIRDTMSQVTGYTGQSSEQKATANGISSITYEQANMISGQLTAIQISVDQSKSITELLRGSVSNIDLRLSELVNLAITRNSYLDDMRKFQKDAFGLKPTLDKIAENTKNL